ncbi:MAG: 3-phosphoshikimate 1-carboxyvinyltransferase, partial [Saprospiraceae bacterium]
EMMQEFGIQTTFEKNGLHLSKSGSAQKPLFEWDFLDCPDIAQTFAVVCAGLGRQGLFTGLETLAIKETDRIAALRNELAKVHTSLAKLPARFSKKQPDRTFYLLEGQAHWDAPPRFQTYEDHRMAMAFAPLGLLQPIDIEHPGVVAKSYPRFWEHLAEVGFAVETWTE